MLNQGNQGYSGGQAGAPPFPLAGSHGGSMQGMQYNLQGMPGRSGGLGMPGGAPPAPQRFAGLGVPGVLQQMQHAAGLQGALAGRGAPPPFGLAGGPPGGGVSGLGAAAAAAAAAAARSTLATSLGMAPGALGPPPPAGGPGPPRPGLDRSGSTGVLGLGGLPGGGPPLARATSASNAALGLGGRAAGFSPAGARAGPGAPPPHSALAASAAAGSDLLALINKGGGGGGGHDASSALLASMLGADGSGLDASGAPFDLSDFPHLGNGSRPGSGSAMGTMAALGLSLEGLDLYGKPQPDFSIQNTEDFPALPGAPKGGKGGGGGDAAHYASLGMPLGSRDGHHLLGDDGGEYGGGYGGPHALSLAQQQQAAAAQAAAQAAVAAAAAARSGAGGRPGAKPGAAAAAAAAAASQPASERYGLLGLLSAIRMSDVDLSTLALGTDLTTLGLNLNSAEALHKTFASPWADSPCPPLPDFALPAAYLQQPPWLAPGLLSRFSAESLFYVFYSCPGEDAQLAAAEELAARGWLWHKELRAWLQRAPGEPPAATGERGERGAYVFFDAGAWERVRKDNFALDYAALDETPRPRPPPPPPPGVPPPQQGPPGQQPQAQQPPGGAKAV